MRRRVFLRLCAGGTVLSMVGCVPPQTVPGENDQVPDDPDDMPEPPDTSGNGDAGVSQASEADAGTHKPPPAEEADAGTGMDAAKEPDGGGTDAASGMDAATEPDAACDEIVIMYDMEAQALYLDGTYGPKFGPILVDYILASVEIELDFWHGHGGVMHKFTIMPDDFEALKRGERVTLTTTEVESHQHTLFIDPTDPYYRLPGADPVEVPLC